MTWKGAQRTRDIGALLFAFLFLPLPAAAQAWGEWQLGGHAKYQLSASRLRQVDSRRETDPDIGARHLTDLRLTAEGRREAFDATAHAELLAVGGSRDVGGALAGRATETGTRLLPGDDRRLLDLTAELANSSDLDAVLRLDRFAIGHTSGSLTIRAGRQAVTWGNGITFQVLDPFNPFPPVEVDRDYKPGDDMLFAQWLFDDGSDVQALLIPRRSPRTGSIAADEGSAAVKYHRRIEALDIDTDIIAAEHYDEPLLGLGVSGTALEGVWRVDTAVSLLENGRAATSVLANIDRSWAIAGKNVYAAAEYFHSGVGSGGGARFPLDEALQRRLERGELFTLGADYASLFGQLEATPLVNIFSRFIANLNDASTITQLYVTYDWRQDISLWAGVTIPAGDLGSEWGGVMPSPDVTVAPETSAFLRLTTYF